MLFENFKQGLNLGGFLSQYELIADAGSKEALQQQSFFAYIYVII